MDAIEQLFASHATERKAAVLEFTPDEIRITAENKFDDGIYQLLYDVWKETSGKYDPKDDKPIVDPRGNVHTQNETKFKYWAMEQYGMTAEEYRGYTFKGTGKTILETAGAYFKVTAPIDAKKGITYLAKKGVTPKNVLKAAFGMTDDVAKELKISARNTGRGNPNAIKHFGVDLNTRQQKLLSQLNGYDSKVIVNKSDVNLKDLAALTAKTGDEFAMFTRGSQRLIVRGNPNTVNININIAQSLHHSGYKWSGHTHPGEGPFVKTASDGDKLILEQFKQLQSVIYDSAGKFNIFGGD